MRHIAGNTPIASPTMSRRSCRVGRARHLHTYAHGSAGALHLARWLPGFGVVEHAGRRSGRRYRTPVNVFRPGASYVIALTYGVRVGVGPRITEAEPATMPRTSCAVEWKWWKE